MPENEATYSINLAGNATEVSKATAEALEGLRVEALASEEAIKRGAQALRELRGKSDEVKEAKEKLRSAMDAERAKLTASNLEILKQGTSLRALNERHKEATEVTKKSTEAHEGLNQGLLKLLGVSREARMKINELGSGFTAAELASAGLVAGSLALVAALGAVAVGAVAAAAAVGRFVVVGADANRSLQFSRQWIAGSAADSARMGDQIDRIRQKVPLTTEELSKLYAKTRQGVDGARVSGEAIKNTVEALAQATGAGADAAAAKIDQIIQRGKNVGRIGINGPSFYNPAGELAGTGLKFGNVAQALADEEKISLDKAVAQLRSYRVPMEVGARALKTAAERAFGEINLEKMTTLDALTKKWDDDLKALTRGLDMGAFWKSIARIENVFSTSTTSGYALKKIIETIGHELGFVGTKSAPIVETAIRMLILQAAKMRLMFLQAEVATKGAFTKDVVATIKQIAGAIGEAAGYALKFASAVNSVREFDKKIANAVGIGPQQAEEAEVEEVGVRASAPAQASAPVVKRAPAHAQGGTVMTPAPGEAFASVAPGEKIVPRGAGAVAGGRRGGGSVVLNVQLSVNVVASSSAAKDVAQAIQKSSVLEDFARALQDTLQGAGIPILPDPS